MQEIPPAADAPPAKSDVAIEIQSEAAPPPYHPTHSGQPNPPPPGPQVVYQQPPPPPTVHVIHTQPTPLVCPVCQNTLWLSHYPLSAWLVGILLFPIGILCCLMMKKRMCTKCGLRISA
ncbi:brain protein I3 [Dendroctonus ponderosae]